MPIDVFYTLKTCKFIGTLSFVGILRPANLSTDAIIQIKPDQNELEKSPGLMNNSIPRCTPHPRKTGRGKQRFERPQRTQKQVFILRGGSGGQ